MLRRVNEGLNRRGGGGSMSYEDLYNMDDEDERRTNRFLILIVVVAVVTYVPRLFALVTYAQYLWKQRKSGWRDTAKERKKMVNSVNATMGSDGLTALAVIILGLSYDYDPAHVITPAVLFAIKLGIVFFWRHSFTAWYKQKRGPKKDSSDDEDFDEIEMKKKKK